MEGDAHLLLKRTLPLRLGFLSETGFVREKNEDAYVLHIPESGSQEARMASAVLAVADGMGGHQAGEVASRLAIEEVKKAFEQATSDSIERAREDLPRWTDDLVLRIHSKIAALGRERDLKRGMGTTLTLAILREDRLYIAHVGDTRCYVLHNGELEQLTRDHTWVAERRDAGLLSGEEESHETNSNVLTQCLGIGESPTVHLLEHAVRAGDRYLLCSDGIHGQVSPETLRQVLIEEDDPQAAARWLVDLANAAGGPDNATAVLLYTASASSSVEARVRVPSSEFRRWIGPLATPILAIGIGAALTGLWALCDGGPGSSSSKSTAVDFAPLPPLPNSVPPESVTSAVDSIAPNDSLVEPAPLPPDPVPEEASDDAGQRP